MKNDSFKPAESKGLEWIEENEDEVFLYNPTSTKKNPQITTSQKGLPLGWSRATFIVRQSYLEDLKNMAYWERETIKDVLDSILQAYFKDKIIRPKKQKRYT